MISEKRAILELDLSTKNSVEAQRTNVVFMEDIDTQIHQYIRIWSRQQDPALRICPCRLKTCRSKYRLLSDL